MVYWLTRVLTRLVFNLLMDVRLEGVEHVPRTGAAIVIGNHPSAIDGHVLIYALPRRAYSYVLATTFQRPVWGWYWRQIGGRPVFSGGDNREAREHGEWALRSGHLLAILPEGDVSSGGRLHPFHGGFLKLAVTHNVPIVPLITVGSDHAIRNAWSPTSLKDFALRRAKIRLRFLPPLWFSNPTLDRAIFAEQLACVERLIAEQVDEIRRSEGLHWREPPETEGEHA
jgi:1-acyl-sn-glycerol-3-phosphate acyltransferase